MTDLFTDLNAPLAHRSRPKTFDEFVGQEHIFKRFPFLKDRNFPSLIIWGPPGTGKTTLANILANHSKKQLYPFNAVLGGVGELRQLIAVAQAESVSPIIFIDEIHRFNKAQQDALLPYVENGSFVLIGATTENPKVSVNRALLSRTHIIELKKLLQKDILQILKNAASHLEEDILITIARFADGDARTALNILDLVLSSKKELTIAEITQLILENARKYDRNDNRHYDVISAFIKSLRGSDPDAAILWLAVMLDGGEDPVFIARRLVIFASEDVGNADPQGLLIATAALHAVQNIGMPEARINLAQAVTYLASTVKSNAAYLAIDSALEFVRGRHTIEVPWHLRSYPPEENKTQYLYPHDYSDHFVKQKYVEDQIPVFYNPPDIGIEKNIRGRLRQLWGRF